MMIPALSVKQPFASLIARGEKTIETRTWLTGYRGPLAICSSAMPKGQGVTRRALCVVFLRHCRRMVKTDERAACCAMYDKAYAWEFDAERRVVLKAMTDVRGRLGIFPLLLPELEFFTPEERDRVYRWLGWADGKGFLQMITTRKGNG